MVNAVPRYSQMPWPISPRRSPLVGDFARWSGAMEVAGVCYGDTPVPALIVRLEGLSLVGWPAAYHAAGGK